MTSLDHAERVESLHCGQIEMSRGQLGGEPRHPKMPMGDIRAVDGPLGVQKPRERPHVLQQLVL